MRVLASIGLMLALLGGTPPAGQAAAGDALGPYRDWNAALPGFASNYERDDRALCASGATICIRRTLGEMNRRFHTVVPVCDHNAVFSLTYQRVTEDIRTALRAGFYPARDRHWLNVLDATFARMYFEAYDNWRSGRRHLVPQSWRMAFGTAERQQVQGIGNLLLAMNAHVQRDFPFALYDTGLIRRDSGLRRLDGTSRKDVHDAYNPRLRAMFHPIVDELSHRFDRTTNDYDVPGLVLDDDTFFSALVTWRATAWGFAQRLDRATSDAERRRVAADIEANANAWATLIQAGSTWPPLSNGPELRNQRCEEYGGQRPGYDRGTDVALLRGAVLEGRRLRLVVRCPAGVGPCAGSVRVAGSIARFAARAGGTRTLEIVLDSSDAAKARAAGFVDVGLTSLLSPGDTVTRQVRVRV